MQRLMAKFLIYLALSMSCVKLPGGTDTADEVFVISREVAYYGNEISTWTIHEFDEHGRETDAFVYNHCRPGDSCLLEQRSYQYGSGCLKQRTRITNYSYPIPGIVESTWTTCQYKYDGLGREVDRSWFGPDGALRYFTLSIYDDENGIRHATTYLADSTCREGWITKFDASGRIAEESFMSCAGAVVQRNIYTYDTDGNLVRMVTYRLIGSQTPFSREMTYDTDGTLVGEITCDSLVHTAACEERKFESDGNGNIICRYVFRVGAWYKEAEFEYMSVSSDGCGESVNTKRYLYKAYVPARGLSNE